MVDRYEGYKFHVPDLSKCDDESENTITQNKSISFFGQVVIGMIIAIVCLICWWGDWV